MSQHDGRVEIDGVEARAGGRSRMTKSILVVSLALVVVIFAALLAF